MNLIADYFECCISNLSQSTVPVFLVAHVSCVRFSVFWLGFLDCLFSVCVSSCSFHNLFSVWTFVVLGCRCTALDPFCPQSCSFCVLWQPSFHRLACKHHFWRRFHWGSTCSYSSLSWFKDGKCGWGLQEHSQAMEMLGCFRSLERSFGRLWLDHQFLQTIVLWIGWSWSSSQDGMSWIDSSIELGECYSYQVRLFACIVSLNDIDWVLQR